ncbi:GMC family oxidoreductase [Jannaschia ovalis]|uniref:GMC family oxidoreductase N-terminal domain-containing protein n=1 Tax=Jannaschia ovalis TaxID=3038773 RepID=A0ABY8LFV7_9RHOB|nr:GMC family oxidoreductase N-terminal domain-containing protein [Jannaschia sp. GRR-S6-38]WGH79230.1 GMC family oxidoreductase N-terminal domain-containing protein [Jannaschia sp. GRR-S6-38]
MEYDIVIVGAGTAGCLLANRLSADPATRVLLLEAGGRDSYPWIHVPAGYLYTMGNPRTDWCLRTEPIPGLAGRALNYPRGRVLGGCSSINGMIYMRGQAADWDGWAQMGHRGWGWADMLPHFKRHEAHVDGGDDLHGATGELRVDRQRLHWPILDAVRDAMVAQGVPETRDFNRGDNEGVGYYQVTQRGGRRLSAAGAFLRPARRRPNLTVSVGAQVARIVIEGGAARGVDLVDGTRIAARRVILSAGAIGSPHLLELSGVGDGARLQRLGIPVVHDLPDVGDHMQDHLQMRPVFRVRNAVTLNDRAATLWGKVRIGLEYALRRTGPLSMAPSQLGAFIRSGEHVATPDLQYHFQPLSLEQFGGDLDPFPAVTASVCNLRPASRGAVHAVSPDPGVPPAIQPNYLSEESDRITAMRAMEKTRALFRAAPLAPHAPEEVRPGEAHTQREALIAEVARNASSIFHPVGTCGMGRVVDDRLQVKGVAGLHVVDASVMPTIVSGNTNAPVLAIAEKAAGLIAP